MLTEQRRVLAEHRAVLIPALARNARADDGTAVDRPEAIAALERAWSYALHPSREELGYGLIRITREEYEAFPNRKARGGPVPASFWLQVQAGDRFGVRVAELWPHPPDSDAELGRHAVTQKGAGFFETSP